MLFCFICLIFPNSKLHPSFSQNYQQWREEDTGEYGSNQERIYKVMDKGYPRLKILWKEAMARIEREPSLLGELNAEGTCTMY